MTPREIAQSEVERQFFVARIRNEPATEEQKVKLGFFGCTFGADITKGAASDAIDECVRQFPEIEVAYHKRPATDEQRVILRSYGEGPDKDGDGPLTYKQAYQLIYRENPDDPDEDGDGPLTYEQAKELIWEMQMGERQEEEAEFERENLIELVARTDYFPSLTVGRVKKAARVLDAINPGWIEGKDNWDLLVKKVVELNPELAAREKWPTHGPDGSQQPCA